MTLSNGQGKNEDEITVAMDSMQELNAAGEAIGYSGPNDGKHSRHTFANTDFRVDDTPRPERADA